MERSGPHAEKTSPRLLAFGAVEIRSSRETRAELIKCLLAVLLCVSLSGWIGVAAVEASERTPLFVVQTVNGTSVPGPLVRLADGWSIDLGGDKPAQFRGADVISLRRSDAVLPPPPTERQIILANGDTIPGEVRELAQDRLHLEAHLGTKQPMRLAVAVLAGLWFQPAASREELDGPRFRRRLLAQRRNQDLVLLQNGDQIEGTLTKLDGKSLVMQVGVNKNVTVDRDRVAAVAFNTDLMRSPRPRGPYGRLVLANGCRLSIAEAKSDDGRTLTAKTLVGAALRVPVEQVVALDILQGRAVYLSSLKPRRYEYTPFLGTEHHSFVADGNWEEGDLRLAGSTFDRGLGMHSKSLITYYLAGGYRSFEGLVGIDDGADQRASARIGVLVDGQAADLGWKGLLARRGGPRPVRVSLTGAKELTLVVDWGRRGFVQGRVNWADARLIK